ncbi:MAG TPA: hypothetical protein VE863_22120 [Pyrinomonadaceae bacterium]|nr:hypothetical protein [Pyrinomonadaceae bacterium]
MAQTKHSSVITLTLDPPALRWLLLVPVLLALIGVWFAVRWYVGNTIAEYTSTPDADGIAMAQMAVRWAPDNAFGYWRLGSLEEKNFSADNLAAAVREFKLAVEVEPFDFRYWMELGRALEAAGDTPHAERALRRAVELAPAYSHPLWQYGNLLLREGRTDEAFAELARAAEADWQMEAPVFGLARQVFGDDLAAITRAFPSSSLRLHFALNLIRSSENADDALRVVETVNAADRKKESEALTDLLKACISARRYRAALALVRDLQTDGEQVPTAENFWNAGFELPLVIADDKPFHWLINSRSDAQVTTDNARPHSGRSSLRIIFKAPNKLDSIPISQTVVVEPDTQYKLQFYARTENLLSARLPVVSISDPAGVPLQSSPPLPSGTNDWQPVTISFRTKPKQEGIVITFYRDPCADKEPICPIFGTAWYDDFSLQRISGGAAGPKPGSADR